MIDQTIIDLRLSHYPKAVELFFPCLEPAPTRMARVGRRMGLRPGMRSGRVTVPKSGIPLSPLGGVKPG